MSLLSFIVSKDRDELSVHADSDGLRILEREIRRARQSLESGKSEHFHLFTENWAPDGELTGSMPSENESDGAKAIQHLKFYAWTQEWKKKNEL